MKTGYKGLTVRSVVTLRDNFGLYMSQCVFLLRGKAAAVYSEPKQMGVYPFCQKDYHPDVRFISPAVTADIIITANQYVKERPYAVTGRSDGTNSVVEMLSDMAWTAAMVKQAESGWRSRTYEYCGNIAYVNVSDEADQPHIIVVFPDDQELNGYLNDKKNKVIAYSDREHKDHIMPDMSSILMAKS